MHVSCSTSPFRQRTRHLPHAAEPLRRKRVLCRSSDGFGTGTPGASADAAELYSAWNISSDWLKFHGISYGIQWDLMGYTYLVGGLEHEFHFSHHIGNVIILTDELIFFRGVGIPATRLLMCVVSNITTVRTCTMIVIRLFFCIIMSLIVFICFIAIDPDDFCNRNHLSHYPTFAMNNSKENYRLSNLLPTPAKNNWDWTNRFHHVVGGFNGYIEQINGRNRPNIEDLRYVGTFCWSPMSSIGINLSVSASFSGDGFFSQQRSSSMFTCFFFCGFYWGLTLWKLEFYWVWTGIPSGKLT